MKNCKSLAIIPLLLLLGQLSFAQTQLPNGTGLTKPGFKSKQNINVLSSTQGLQIQTLPRNYDLRALGRLTPVRSQGQIGTCWAFATGGSLESSILSFESNNKADFFSEKNLKNKSGYLFNPNNGGNHMMAMSYLARWSGPVPEELDPYSIKPESDKSPQVDAKKFVYKIDSVDMLPSKNLPEIKRWIMENGALYTVVLVGATDRDMDAIFNDKKSAFYNPKEDGAGHAVDIVGWDDDYPKANFKKAYGQAPKENGAFIMRNSWDSNWGDKGYFYISYEDVNVAQVLVGFKAQVGTKYNRIYQYDTFEPNLWWGAEDAENNYAVSFKASSDEDLQAVGIFTEDESLSYRIKVGNTLAEAQKATPSALGALKYGGYHTIKLTNAYKLVKNQTFFVLVEQSLPKGFARIPVSAPQEGYIPNFKAKTGVFYLQIGGDSYEEGSKVDKNITICLKAFSTDRTQNEVNVSSLRFAEDSVVMYVGESHETKVLIYPENATKKDVNYFIETKYANSVKISKDGVITALKPGVFEIKAVLADQSIVTSLDLTVLATTGKTDISFKDEVLESSVRTALNKKGGALKQSDLDSLKSLAIIGELRSLKEIGLLKNLQSLDLSNTRLTDFTPLSQLKSLSNLSLSKTQIVDTAFLSSLTNVASLDLSESNIKAFTDLSKLKGLKNLSLAGTQISDVKAISALTSLESLDLRQTRVKIIEPVKQFAKLTSLYLAGTLVNDIASLVDFQKQLKNKDFDAKADSKKVRFSDPRIEDLIVKVLKVKNIDNITAKMLDGIYEIDLSNIDVGKSLDLAGVEQLKNLRELYTEEHKLIHPEVVASLKSLEGLSMYNSGLSSIGFISALTKLEYLDLGSNKIVDIKPLASLTNLTELYLVGNQITDASPLFKLDRLTVLDISNNKLPTFASAKPMKSLSTLNVSSNSIKSYKDLSNQTQLNTLFLRDNPAKDFKSITNIRANLAAYDFEDNGETFDPDDYDFDTDFDIYDYEADTDEFDDEDYSEYDLNLDYSDDYEDPYYDEESGYDSTDDYIDDFSDYDYEDTGDYDDSGDYEE